MYIMNAAGCVRETTIDLSLLAAKKYLTKKIYQQLWFGLNTIDYVTPKDY